MLHSKGLNEKSKWKVLSESHAMIDYHLNKCINVTIHHKNIRVLEI